MHIRFERTGGFAGQKLKGYLDSSDLSLAQARRLKDLLRQSRFFELPAILQASVPGADRFNYRVTVECEEGTHTVQASDAAIPGEMRPLLDFLARSLRTR
jgi:hypothetical protein